MESSASAVRRARVAVSISFYLFGLAFAVWAIHIPAIAARLALDPAVLGAALLTGGLGGLVGQPFTGLLMARAGARLSSIILMPLTLLSLLLPIIAPSVPLLFAGVFVWGAVSGALNVAVNTQATDIERMTRKPIMSTFHGFFSLGQLTGAVLGSPIYALGLADGRGAAIAAALGLCVAFIVSPYYLRTTPDLATQVSEKRRFAFPVGPVVVLFLLCFFCDIAEGAVSDWSTLYLSTVRQLPEFVANSGYVAYAIVMTASRFASGPLIARLGDQRVILIGGISIAVGIAVVVFAPWAWLSPIGFALLAAGAANNYPVLISAGSRIPGVAAGTAVTAVATGGLMGFLVGPPVIGFIAHAMGLAAGVGSLILFGFVVAIGAGLNRWPARTVATRSPQADPIAPPGI